MLKQRLQRRWADTAEALASVNLSVSEAGLLATTPRLETRVEWSAYTDALECPTGFLLYRGREFALVPIRAFPASDELEVFRNLLGRRIEGPRWRRSRAMR